MVCLIVFVGYFAYIVYPLIFWFGLEDRFVGTYQPVIKAITAYQEKNDSPPPDINDLSPEYIDSIPKLKEVKSFEYNLINKKDWELIAIVEAKGRKKEFVYRTTQELTA